MGNENSKKSHETVHIPDNHTFSSIVKEVASEIDHEYTSKSHHELPDFVKPIASIQDLYTPQNQIGKGISGVVLVAQSLKTHKQYALKQMPTSDKENHASFMREITVLQHLHHPNVIHFNDAYVSKQHYYIVTEYCCGGTLLERIVKLKRFSEKDCARFMQKIIEGVHHMHSNHIVHRDLKLSNVVFDKPDIKHSKLKIIDFGESELITDLDQTDSDCIGSLHFFAPESIRTRRKRELFAGDMWAIGVMAYTLIQGVFPYKARNIKAIIRCIAFTHLTWPTPVSDSCKHFIRSLLHKQCAKRLTAKDALSHPWIVSKARDDNLGDGYFERLQRLNYQNKLQRIMVHAALDTMDDMDKKEMLSYDGYADDSQLINQILSGATPTGSAVNVRKRDALLPKTEESETYQLFDEMDIDDILDEVDIALDHAHDDTCSPAVMQITPVGVPVTPRMDDEIPVDRFVDILESSAKKYDVDEIVATISNDGADPITYRGISAYHKTLHSLEAIDLSEL
eukprot:727108_1